jgi:outer membrane protein assembly factor BamD
MNKGLLYSVIFFCFSLLLSSCSDFQKILKSDNPDKKLEAAFRYYEKEDYYRAGMLFEELIPVLKGRAESEKAQFYFANTHFYEAQYILSAYYFKNFYETYPRSEFAEEAMFMHAKSLYKDSPAPNLDQTSTYSAMEAIQGFLNRYPATNWKEEANAMYDGLSKKLELKAFENARLYHQLRYYQSAVVAFNNFEKEFPASEFNEEAAFLRIESQYNLARLSVAEKQRERYFESVAYYQAFVDKFPNSKYLKSAEAYYDNSVAQIEKIKLTSSTSN